MNIPKLAFSGTFFLSPQSEMVEKYEQVARTVSRQMVKEGIMGKICLERTTVHQRDVFSNGEQGAAKPRLRPSDWTMTVTGGDRADQMVATALEKASLRWDWHWSRQNSSNFRPKRNA